MSKLGKSEYAYVSTPDDMMMPDNLMSCSKVTFFFQGKMSRFVSIRLEYNAIQHKSRTGLARDCWDLIT